MFLLDQVNLNADDEEEDDSQNDEYTIKEEMILVKREFDLLTGADEQTISQEGDLFKVKFPLISDTDFDFVKRKRNTILTPVVKENHLWDYAHVKPLFGAGKLYVRLDICKDVISVTSSDDSDSTSLPVMLPPLIIGPKLVQQARHDLLLWMMKYHQHLQVCHSRMKIFPL